MAKRTGCSMSCLKAHGIETNPRSVLVGDRSPKLPIGRSEFLRRRLVADQSPTSRRLVGNHLATYATPSRSNSVAASLLCMFKRQLATDFNRRLVGDLKKTFPRPLQPLCDFSFFLVANQLQTGCRVGVSTPLDHEDPDRN